MFSSSFSDFPVEEAFVVDESDFTLQKQLNISDDAEFWLANETANGRTCIVKKCRGNGSRFLKDAVIFSQMRNPLSLEFVGCSCEFPYCIFLKYEGVRLIEYIISRKLSSTRMTIIATGIAYAMMQFHKNGIGVPELNALNVLLIQGVPKVSPFPTTGSVKWKAPELMRREKYSMKSDVFNFGIILYEMMVQQPAFRGLTAEMIENSIGHERKRLTLPKTNPEMAKMIRDCWRDNPIRRPTFTEIFDSFASSRVAFDGCDRVKLEEFCASLQDKPKRVIRQKPPPEINQIPAVKPKETISHTLDPNDSEIEQFLASASKKLSEKCSVEAKTSVLVSISRLLMNRPVAVCAFEKANFIRVLPWDDHLLLDSVLSVINPLFASRPDMFQEDFVPIMCKILDARLDKGLILLSIYAESFDNLVDPWSLLDLLFRYERVFMNSSVGSEYISLLTFLCCNHDIYRESRMKNCQRVFCRFLSSPDKTAAQCAYKALCVFDKDAEMPVDRIVSDLYDPELAIHAVSLLIRMNEVHCDSEIVKPLFVMAQHHPEAALLLLKITSRSVECSRAVAVKSDWLLRDLPTFEYTIKLMLVLLRYETLHDTISEMEHLGEFMASLVFQCDHTSLSCLSCICDRLPLSRSVIASLRSRKVFPKLLQLVKASNVKSRLVMLVLGACGRVGYAPEYLLFSEKLREWLYDDDSTSHNSLDIICLLSKYTACAKQYAEMGIGEEVIELFTEPQMRRKIQQLIWNLENLHA